MTALIKVTGANHTGKFFLQMDASYLRQYNMVLIKLFQKRVNLWYISLSNFASLANS